MFEDEEQNPMSMTIDGHPLKAMKSKVLTEETQPCVTSFWNKKKKLNVEIHYRHWERASNSTKETRLRVLQWKILHNIHPTNILQNKMEIADSNKFSAYSSDDTDNTEHFFFFFFFSCSKIKPVWDVVEREINAKKNAYQNY